MRKNKEPEPDERLQEIGEAYSDDQFVAVNIPARTSSKLTRGTSWPEDLARF